MWTLTALLLDAYAATTQTLVGFFLGAGRVAVAQRVAAVGCQWGVATGVLLVVLMLAGTRQMEVAARPGGGVGRVHRGVDRRGARATVECAVVRHRRRYWGTGDFRYLRNAMLAATLAGGGAARGDRRPLAERAAARVARDGGVDRGPCGVRRASGVAGHRPRTARADRSSRGWVPAHPGRLYSEVLRPVVADLAALLAHAHLCVPDPR